MLRKSFLIGLLVLLALALSGLSMFIKRGANAVDSETIGTVSTWGFPLHYMATAPGLARPQFATARFWMNSCVWLMALMALTAIWRNRSP